MIPFTHRELVRASRDNRAAYQSANPRSNAHRLLLFYAVECGLKAKLLRQRGLDSTIGCQELTNIRHSINRLLDLLRAGNSLKLPSDISLGSMRFQGRNIPRNAQASDLNQLWRYGGTTATPSDAELEAALVKVTEWIDGDIR